MRRVVYFENCNQKIDLCCDEVYRNFIDSAFSKTDYVMLVYVNYYGKGYSKQMKMYRDLLKPFKVKSRSDPHWPGTPGTYSQNTTYKIVFYKNCRKTKDVLKTVSSLSSWTRPLYPQDLAFFIGNQCWFYSVGHEKIGAIIRADEDDIQFVISHKLGDAERVFLTDDSFYNTCDEEI